MSAGRFPSTIGCQSERLQQLKYLAIVGVLALVAGCGSAGAKRCPELRPIADLYAVYEVVDVEKYRGGLTTQEQAEALVGQEIELDAQRFSLGETTIEEPQYRLQCHPSPVEGEVSAGRWSNFYGYGIERQHVEVLEVIATHETEASYQLEVIGPRELWWLYDGWLYRMWAH